MGEFNRWRTNASFLFLQYFGPLTKSFLYTSHRSFTETDYLETYAENPSQIYFNSAIDPAMANAYLQTRKFIMAMFLITEAEANTFITQAVDFAMTQVVDGNWGVHAIIPKDVFVPLEESEEEVEVSLPIVQRMVPPEADLPLNSENVHWGFFSKDLDPVLTVKSGDEVVVEMATHHACDDWDKMIKGDEGTSFSAILCSFLLLVN